MYYFFERQGECNKKNNKLKQTDNFTQFGSTGLHSKSMNRFRPPIWYRISTAITFKYEQACLSWRRRRRRRRVLTFHLAPVLTLPPVRFHGGRASTEQTRQCHGSFNTLTNWCCVRLQQHLAMANNQCVMCYYLIILIEIEFSLGLGTAFCYYSIAGIGIGAEFG